MSAQVLHAGALTLLYEHGDIRSIKVGKREVVRRVYGAVRDRNWGTVPAKITNVRVTDSGRSFQIDFDSEHDQDEISFHWHGTIRGEENSSIEFIFDGQARSTFPRNRIGLCVLHPIRECSGQKCLVEYADGTTAEHEFPTRVAPEQPIRGLQNLRAISYAVDAGFLAEVRFSGDLFETEDQRNWIDASFKTYSTPLHLPFPVEIQAGTRVRQSVTIRLNSDRSATPRILPPPQLPVARMPVIGLGTSSTERKYSDALIEKLRALNLGHLRIDLDLTTDWEGALQFAEWESAALNVPLELAVSIGPTTPLDMFVLWLKNNPRRVCRIAVFTKGAESTTLETLEKAREAFSGVAPIGVGTNADFYQLNQVRPPWQEADFICWSMNPQVHAFDDRSILETPEAVPAQIESARVYFPGKPLVISPVTLRPRFNPVAAYPRSSLEIPPDSRQTTELCAHWTRAMFSALAGVESVTFFETFGPAGLLDDETVFPVYNALPKAIRASEGMEQG